MIVKPVHESWRGLSGENIGGGDTQEFGPWKVSVEKDVGG